MDYKTLTYQELIENPCDFYIKVMCKKYTLNNNVSQVLPMFQYMCKYFENTTFHNCICDDVTGYMCTCVGYIKASNLLKNFVDISLEQSDLKPIFYLWKEPYNENCEELKDVVLHFEVLGVSEMELINKIRNILLNSK